MDHTDSIEEEKAPSNNNCYSDEDTKIKSFKEVSNLIKGNVIRDLNSNQNLRKTYISNTANIISFEDDYNNEISKNIMFISHRHNYDISCQNPIYHP